MLKKAIIMCALTFIFLSLVIQLVPAPEISDESSITLPVKGLIRCDKSPENYGKQWIDGTGGTTQISPTTGENGNCFPSNASLSLDSSCCPGNDLCMESSTPNPEGKPKGACEYSIETYCYEIKDADRCNGAVSQAENFYWDLKFPGVVYCNTRTLLGDIDNYNCWKEIHCRCNWTGTGCNATAEEDKLCTPEEFTPQGKCEDYIISVDDLCETEGYISYTIGSNWIDLIGTSGAPPECNVNNVIVTNIPCGSVAKLGFFSIFNFISVIICLMIIYYFYSREDFGNK